MKHSLDEISGICVGEGGHATHLSIMVSLHFLMGEEHHIWVTSQLSDLPLVLRPTSLFLQYKCIMKFQRLSQICPFCFSILA